MTSRFSQMQSAYFPTNYYYGEGVQYPGSNGRWVYIRDGEEPLYDAQYNLYQTNPSSQNTSQSTSDSQSPKPAQGTHSGQTARLSWATEIPTKLRVTICCDQCKLKLQAALRDVDGVYDVGVAGWANALVTVTGTAAGRDILREARRVSSTAEFWGEEFKDHQFTKASHAYDGYHMH